MGVPLRYQLGIVSVNRAKFLANQKCEGLRKVMDDDDDDKKKTAIQTGTPTRPVHRGEFKVLTKKKVVPARRINDVQLLPHISPSEAATQMCKLFREDATQDCIPLIMALAQRVEDDNLLPGFSSIVAAAACVRVVSNTLATEPLLRAAQMKQLKVLPGPIRVACNTLWLKRTRLEAIVESKGGDPTLFPTPKKANGEIDFDVIFEGVLMTARIRKRRPQRHEVFESTPSFLMYGERPPEDRDEIRFGSDGEREADAGQWLDASEWPPESLDGEGYEDDGSSGSWGGGASLGESSGVELPNYGDAFPF